ncbi:MAG: glycerate kinase [Proteobacteria bacterium]|nr:glycerate kinase [Pseudomonadota bacterium]MDA0994364.1 glycerate kinase [Pseudomonadota bacterium]
MKVICAPDSFKESLTAVEVADAMAVGIRRAAPGARIDTCPVGDGGEGTLESLLASVDGKTFRTAATDLFGRKTETHFGSLDCGRVAFIESATVIGLATVPARERDIMRSSSFGVGQLMLSACETTPEKIIVGVGGSATNDGGCGLAQALGVRFYDAAGNLIASPISAAMLQDICHIDVTNRSALLEDKEILVACDVSNPLTGPDGAAYIFAPQKGASESQVVLLDESLRHLAEIIRRDLRIDIEMMSGAGAAGGLGGGLMAFAGARIVSGIDIILEAVRFNARVQNSDLCLTGEGTLDAQSLAGKACIGVARAASAQDVPVVVLTGKIGPGAERVLDAGVTEFLTIGEGLSTGQSIRQAAGLLADAAEKVTRKYR